MLRSNAVMLFIGLLIVFLSGCGGHSQIQPKLCTSSANYTGERLDHALDLSTLTHQDAINLSREFEPADIAELNKTRDWIIANTDITDFTVTLALPGKGSWTSTHLITEPKASQLAPDAAIFWWMSVGKAYTAAVIHQLANEQKLDLNDKLSQWFPQIKNAQLISINQLLNHTSGLYSFQEDTQFRAQSSYQAPQALLDIALAHDPQFCPGAAWYYSNTGYLILGLLIEKIENKSYLQVIDERLVKPLGLSQTKALGPNEFPGNLVLTPSTGDDNSVAYPSLPFSAGNIVSSSRDMVIFLQALLTGNLYGAQQVQAATDQLYPMFDAGLYYGRGIMHYRVDTPQAKVNWLGHSGGTETKNSLIAYDLDSGAYIAVAVNDKTSAAAIATRFFAVAKSIQLRGH